MDALQRQLNESKKWTLSKWRQIVAKSLQKAIRAEAAAFVGAVKYSDGTNVKMRHSPIGHCVCVTCGTVHPWTQLDAGHFLGGRRPSILFEEVGLHSQCRRCNKHLGGNSAVYEHYMTAVYGSAVVQELHRLRNQVTVTWSKEELCEKRVAYMQRIKVAQRKMDNWCEGTVTPNKVSKTMSEETKATDLEVRDKALQACGKKLQSLCGKMRKRGVEMLTLARDAGLVLLEAKEQHPKSFKTWVNENCPVDYSQATRWMKLANNWHIMESVIESHDEKGCPSQLLTIQGAIKAINQKKQESEPTPEPDPKPEPTEPAIKIRIEASSVSEALESIWAALDAEERVEAADWFASKLGQSVAPVAISEPKPPAKKATKKKKPSNGHPDGFERFWAIVHRKVGRGNAEKAYERAVEQLRDKHDDPESWINERMALFATSPQARGKITGKLHPATWLNQSRFDDDESTWFEGQGSEVDEYVENG